MAASGRGDVRHARSIEVEATSGAIEHNESGIPIELDADIAKTSDAGASQWEGKQGSRRP